MRRPYWLAVLGALLAASCSSNAPAGSRHTSPTASPTAAQSITVHATNLLRFQPATIKAHVGTVRITLVDDGAYPHNISLPALHKTSKTVTGDLGGKQTTVTLVFSKPGTYAYECTYHAGAGMRGKIVISAVSH